jgi:hypothetical protein
MVPMPEDEETAEVVRREQQLLDPRRRAAGDRVQELLHPDFVEYGSSGRAWDRAAITAALGHEPEVSGDATDFSPVALAENVVLLTYRIVGPAGSLRSSVWVKDPQAGWRLRFHQGTRSLQAG